MKYTFQTLFAITASSFMFMGGCLQKLTTLNIDYPTEGTVQTSALTSTGTQTFGETVLTSGLKAELEKNNTSLDLLDELKLKSAKISIENDTTQNFDNVENIELYVAADQQKEVLIASANNIPDGSRSVVLNVNSSENLANYIKANTFTYRIKGTNSAAIPAMTLKANVVWAIKASAK